ncbi:CpsD/CapB family tyrosine-protein kinase [Clostridium sp.]|uniref:CpsD/CapB family tyrosine-protein kinase n=1 Tax=Clostridium sp. TaxID=1506 RepID=UPI0032173F0A
MYIVEKEPKSIAAESYRTLRTNLQYSSFDEEYKVIVVTSSEPGEGKSTTSGNLALSLAQGDKKVILVDCDLRKPSIHKKFKISNELGLSDVIVDKESISSTGHKYNNNLTVLTSGKIPPNPSEMLGSKSMKALIDALKKVFDYVILDTPPVQAVTDAQILSTRADGTILVVRAERTKKDSVENAVGLLKKVNANIIGTVLNGVEEGRGNYYYYYGDDGK